MIVPTYCNGDSSCALTVRRWRPARDGLHAPSRIDGQHRMARRAACVAPRRIHRRASPSDDDEIALRRDSPNPSRAHGRPRPVAARSPPRARSPRGATSGMPSRADLARRRGSCSSVPPPATSVSHVSRRTSTALVRAPRDGQDVVRAAEPARSRSIPACSTTSSAAASLPVQSVAATVIREACGGAGIVRRLAGRARPAGTVHLCRGQPDGLQRETIFVARARPAGRFGRPARTTKSYEHDATARRRAGHRHLTSGVEVVTADASLVVLDCLLRHGAIPRDVAGFRRSTRCARPEARSTDQPTRPPAWRRGHGPICRIPISASVSRTALTACRISSGPIAPMQPTRNVSTCVSLPG